ncbi:MAG: hypothetical protein C6I00_04365 [Nitratiruptor sp.]|nr:hypothetical protein [Nitratiruptor sp.]NPA84020.1 hypothetical protein [Campylobacterota bacterium]
MILYIHGFASCGRGKKSQALKDYFGSIEAPDLPVEPRKAIDRLEELIATGGIDLLVGSSLGGYYATYLAWRHGIRAVLINPSTRPYETLARYVGWQRRFCDGAPFYWSQEFIDQLPLFQVPALPSGLFLVLLQTGDEVLDYRIALEYYQNQRRVVEYGGNHRFENIEDYLFMIDRFRGGSHGGD